MDKAAHNTSDSGLLDEVRETTPHLDVDFVSGPGGYGQ